MRTFRPLLVVVFLVLGCTAPEQTATTCDELAHELAEVLLASIDAKADEFASTAQVPDSELPSAEPDGKSPDAFSTANTMADSTEGEGDFRARIERIEQASQAQDCGEDGWANPIVASDLRADLERRYEALDGKPSGEEHIAMNLLASVLVVMEGRAEGTDS